MMSIETVSLLLFITYSPSNKQLNKEHSFNNTRKSLLEISSVRSIQNESPVSRKNQANRTALRFVYHVEIFFRKKHCLFFHLKNSLYIYIYHIYIYIQKSIKKSTKPFERSLRILLQSYIFYTYMAEVVSLQIVCYACVYM